jgi:hypothetical protein
MIDSKLFGTCNNHNRVWLVERKKCHCEAGEEANSLTTEDLMLCDFQIPGFVLFNKRWCWFSVDFVEPVHSIRMHLAHYSSLKAARISSTR